MKLKRKGKGSYITIDGNFELYRIHGTACAAWQARAIHGQPVFEYTLFGKRYKSPLYNGDTLMECREAVDATY